MKPLYSRSENAALKFERPDRKRGTLEIEI